MLSTNIVRMAAIGWKSFSPPPPSKIAGYGFGPTMSARAPPALERRYGALAGLDLARVDDQGEDDQAAVLLFRQERHRRRGHDVGDERELFRSGFRRLHEGVDRVGRRGQDQHAADDRAHLVEPEPDVRHDAEVAAAAADCPEQIGVRLGVHA
jgi:hypothetical protein